MTPDKRTADRRKVGHNAVICDRNGTPICGCTLDDVSKGGGRLKLADNVPIPDEFVLLLAHRGKVRRMCRPVWRNGDLVGVKFMVGQADGQARQNASA